MTNLTIEVLQRILKSEESRRGALPKRLYLQLDNCARENKNTAVAVFLAFLLERGVFNSIYVSYLPVGHTHNECDQLASRLAVAIRWTGASTLADFLDILRAAVSPSPQVEMLNTVANMVGMMNPSGSPHWSRSKARFFEGILALESMTDAPLQQEGVAARHTSTLHFCFKMSHDKANRLVPVVCTKSRSILRSIVFPVHTLVFSLFPLHTL